MLWKQQPRNRRIAEVLAKCGLVERAGQGADTIFEESIKQGKPLPNFDRTDEYEVVLTLDGQIQDENFLRFLEKLNKEGLTPLFPEDFLVLDFVHRERPIPSAWSQLKENLKRLIELGIVERIGKGRGTKYLLCHKYYKFSGQSGVYTRRKGLDKDTNKALLLKHIQKNAETGSSLSELCQVLPALSERQIRSLVQELKHENLLQRQGKTKASQWFPINIAPN